MANLSFFLVLELFILRFFIGSLIAYSYLKKWRYIIQQIDLHARAKDIPKQIQTTHKIWDASTIPTIILLDFKSNISIGGIV
jgi:hypothetical protein